MGYNSLCLSQAHADPFLDTRGSVCAFFGLAKSEEGLVVHAVETDPLLLSRVGEESTHRALSAYAHEAIQ
jgi:hypothetical protein